MIIKLIKNNIIRNKLKNIITIINLLDLSLLEWKSKN